MKFRIFDFPEEPAEQADWLEAELCSPQLCETVAEFQVVHGDADSGETLDAILGDKQQAVLQSGLSILNTDSLRRLVQSPRSLLELQELVLQEGGDWVDARLKSEKVIGHSVASLRTMFEGQPIPKSRPMVRRPLLVAVLGIVVAAVVIGFFLYPPPPPKATWGWLAPDAFTGETSREAYMMKVAQGADAWFAKRPTKPEDIRKRTEEFLAGCRRVIAAQHEPLRENDRKWLRMKCRDWYQDIGAELRALDQGSKDTMIVRANIDKIARRMAEVIRSRVIP